MKPPKPLTPVFLQHTKRHGDLPADGEELERLLKHAVDRGCQGKPFGLADKVFVGYVAHRLPPTEEGVTLAQVFAKMNLEDLYLACACVHKVPEAIATLEAHHLTELRTWLMRTNSVSVVDEVCQNVRIQLLVGLTPAGPRLATYRGNSTLQHWINVVASRLLPPGKQPSGNGSLPASLLDALENIPFQGPNSEIELIKRRFMDAFRQALSDVLDELPKEQRRLLWYYYVKRLTTTKLGKIIGKDQSTASRKLALAREAVYEKTKRLLKERLSLASKEFDSFLAEIQSILDVSLSRILGETDDEEDERRFMDDFHQALSDVLDGLPKEQRRLLWHYYVKRLTAIELGKKIGEDQLTVSRRLELAREAVYEKTKCLLKERLPLDSTEFESLLAVIESNLDVSISQILGEMDDEDDETDDDDKE
ncbi:hypothetical protein CYFUS_004416 [Cystobacter fuscus]|uniref:DNA-binding regulatory protein n=1 Tax=Cystobacter fuscus TaxID=43 RepID=A0A250J669_9BACT|nr:hypothetical protein [Cystobacter fuscus]ATB38977.1 hypothetical protein CYFUS_004416 [Cystobacter fuscus]